MENARTLNDSVEKVTLSGNELIIGLDGRNIKIPLSALSEFIGIQGPSGIGGVVPNESFVPGQGSAQNPAIYFAAGGTPEAPVILPGFGGISLTSPLNVISWNGSTAVAKGVPIEIPEPDTSFLARIEATGFRDSIYDDSVRVGRYFTPGTLNGAISSISGVDITGFIPVPSGATIRLDAPGGVGVAKRAWVYTSPSSGAGYYSPPIDGEERAAVSELIIDVPVPASGQKVVWLATYLKTSYLPVSIQPFLRVSVAKFSVKTDTREVPLITTDDAREAASGEIERIGVTDSRYSVENGVFPIYGENQYDGTFVPNKYPNDKGVLVTGENNDTSSLIPVYPGAKVIADAPGFPEGVRANFRGYSENNYSSQVEIISGPLSTVHEFEFIVPPGVFYLATLTRINGWQGRSNAAYLRVRIETPYKSIATGGQEISTKEIIDSGSEIIEEIASESASEAVREGLENFGMDNYRPVVPPFPMIPIDNELAATDPTALVKDPATWDYKAIILNVMEVLRAENPEYISLIGDVEQTSDPQLPLFSIGLSKTNGSRPQYPIYAYDFAPPGYEQTAFVFSCEHGSEQESTIGLCRVLQMICNDWKSAPQIAYLRHKVRIIVVPVLSPWGYNNTSRNNAQGININRNWDYNWASIDNSDSGSFSGVGSAPMLSENKLMVDALRSYIDEADWGMTFHAGSPPQPYWFSCPPDHLNHEAVRKVSEWLCMKNGFSFPADVRGLDNPSYSAISTYYFTKILNVPFVTMDYTMNYPDFGVRYGAKAMSIQVEQILNMFIGHAYSKIEPRETRTRGNNFISRPIPSPVSREFGHVHEASALMVESNYDRLLDAYPNRVSKNVIARSLGNKYDVLCYTFEPSEEVKKTIIVIGGLFTSIGQVTVYDPATSGSRVQDFTDGLRHVFAIPHILEDILSRKEDTVLESIGANTRIIVVPVSNPNDVYDTVSSVNLSELFGTDNHLSGFSNRPEAMAIASLIKANPSAQIITFNEIDDPDENVQFRFNHGFTYPYKSGNFALREYIEDILPRRGITSSASTDSVDMTPANSLLNWAFFNNGSNGVVITNRDISHLGARTWDILKVTELMNFFINVINRF